MSADSSPELRPDFLDDFHAEAEEHVGNIRAQLSALESEGEQSAPQTATLESIFRSMHSLKGLSGMVGLRPAEDLAHAAEDFLRPLSRGGAMVDPAAVELLFAVLQRLEETLGAHRQRREVPSGGDLLTKLAEAMKAGPAKTAADAADRGAAPKASEVALWRCVFRPSRELDLRGVNITSVRARLGMLGKIETATPAIKPGGSIEFEFIVSLREPPANRPAWEADGITFTEIEATGESESTDAPAAAGSTAAHRDAASASIAPSHLVRVDLSRLDDLMRIVGEMVIHRSRPEERVARLAAGDGEIKEANQALARSLRQLRSAITRVRLVPVEEIFTRMPFVVRELARETGKKVRLLLEGQHTEIDKYLVERLKEPLLHLVRNAFSHGVEPPEERTARGKPAEATILLRARTAGEFVLIEVRDDGRGVDAGAVARRAAELGVTVPEQLDEAGLLQVLCAQGFSTRHEADRAAGRGVGMNVVFTTVRALGGTLALETQPGRGTCFTLRLPLTLSIAESIIVSAGGQTCAVPQGFIDEIIQVPESEVRAIKQAEVIPYRDGVLPLLRLRSLFGAARSERPEFSVLVLSSEQGSTGLAVDRVHTQREIVVRPMADPLLQVPGISGATELGDGRPVLILDPIAITNGVVRPRTHSPPATFA